MQAMKSQIPTFGGNPGSFHRQTTLKITRLLVKIVRSMCRGEFREGANAGLAGLCNIGNQLFRRRANPRFICSCCGYKTFSFMHLSNRIRIAWNSACPICDSRSRHRGLALLVPKIIGAFTIPKRVLHFAPEAVLSKIFLAMPNVEYRTTDLFVKDVDYPGENIEKLSFRDGAFDIALCNHVLEHVASDETAMSELARILTTNGVAVITIPGDWNRKSTITFANTDFNGHHRDYGMEVVGRFQNYFRTVEVIDLHQLDSDPTGLSYGIRPKDLAFICRQPYQSEAPDGRQITKYS
jgi:SAM-dependent methyltransferase